MCDVCRQVGKCLPRCPNYISPKSNLVCDICGEPIFPDEEYVENNDPAAAHVDCFIGNKDLLRWLGYDVKIKECEENDYEL